MSAGAEQTLKSHPLFSHLSSDELSALANHMQEISLPKNSIIFRENDISDKCYFIQSGEVAISTEDAGDQIVATLKEIDLFGETGIILGTKRNATAKTLTDCKLFYIDKNIILEFIQNDPMNKNKMMQFIRSRSQIIHNNHIQIHTSINTIGENIYLLKNLVNKEIFELSEEGYFIWQLINGKKTLGNIILSTTRQYPEIPPKEILQLFIDLNELGFVKIKGNIESQHELEEGKSWFIRKLSKIPQHMEIFYHFKNVDNFITKTYFYIKWFFSPFFQIIMLTTAAIGLICFLKLIPYAFLHLSLLSIKEFIILYIAFFTLLFFHELSHAYATKHFGYEIKAMGVGWFWLLPAAYCDTSDILLAPKKERLIVNVIGIYLEAFISGIACIIGLIIQDPLFTSVCWLFALLNYFNIIYNLDPAIDLDGYYIFQDLTEDMDIRENTVKWIFQQRFTHIQLHFKEFIFSAWLIVYHFSIIPLIWWTQFTVLSKFIPLFSHSVISLFIPFVIVALSITSAWSLIKLKE
jgi:hypothetical protein